MKYEQQYVVHTIPPAVLIKKNEYFSDVTLFYQFLKRNISSINYDVVLT